MLEDTGESKNHGTAAETISDTVFIRRVGTGKGLQWWFILGIGDQQFFQVGIFVIKGCGIILQAQGIKCVL